MTETMATTSSLDQLVSAIQARDEAREDAINLAVVDHHLRRITSRKAQDWLLDRRLVLTARIAARAASAAEDALAVAQ